MMDAFYWFWILSWAMFYGIHSGLAAQKTKDWSQRNLGSYYKYYRVSYNVFHILAMIWIWWYGMQHPTHFLFGRNIFTIAFGILLILRGLSIGLAAFRTMDSGEFLFGKQTEAQPEWVESGWYGRVRHPLYLALIYILCGSVLCWPSLKVALFILVTFLYLPIGIYWEEKKLLKTFGSKYQSYKQRTPKILPHLWF